ncbi:hypothetical protein [Nocardioides aurantiacus]|uniref:Uncharacterized protein n=1 Tax=Nocardioides aurantiacus TaxID=86796 RepID=A0A3N2CV73_9ACTN|nr:hypothetical protein [Nocardioides aurantiacus]ROR91318.1 hypothetical protein EDD33_2184 [Nocardioides aurantiacus]
MSGSDAGRVHLRLMNEFGCDPPLWDELGGTDGEGLDLSDGLLADLSAFADRWEAAVPAEVFDDRWDGVPVMQQLVSLRYTLLGLRPATRRRTRAEDRTLRELGESLRQRLQDELGDGYRVTYQH